jgi:hypothetical protein
MLAVVLTFDRLPCPALGCYGNEWIDTPAFDRLAAEGFVFDAHIARTAEQGASFPPWLDPSPNWLTALSAAGVRTMLLREVRSALSWDVAQFDDVVSVDGRDGADVPPREWPFARLMQSARDWLTQLEVCADHQLLWLHSAGLPRPCAVPEDVEALYLDEFSDRGVDWSQLSDAERGLHPAVQAGYLSVMDHFLGEFVDALAELTPRRPCVLTVTAARGGDWQANGVSGLGQRLWTPSIWWTPPSSTGRAILPGRSPAIVQPQDVGPTLLEVFSQSGATSGHSLWPLFDGTAARVCDAAVVDGRAVWTERDFTVFAERPVVGRELDIATTQHFLWPEDTWQVNDVAALRAETVAERARLAERGTSVP